MRSVLFSVLGLFWCINAFAQYKVELLRSNGKLYYRGIDEMFHAVASERKVTADTECKGPGGLKFVAPAGSIVVTIANLGEYLSSGPVLEAVGGKSLAIELSAEDKLLTLINKVRSNRGLSLLSKSAKLALGALNNSKRMASTGKFMHSRDPFVMNIAQGQESAEDVFGNWMNNPGCHNNILDPKTREFGASKVENYWTMYVQ